jgi:NAD(P)-dependent dehydrogenase (short-subunit alcohol dehydrogenase family)
MTHARGASCARGAASPGPRRVTIGVMDLLHVSGKVVLVMGAGSGLGEGLAQAVAEAGAMVACADIDVTSAHKTVDHMPRLGCQATAVDVDVAEEASVQRMVETTVHQFGALDVIVCNAGIGGEHSGRAHDLPLEVWHHVIAVNLTGVFLCVRGRPGHDSQGTKWQDEILTSSICGQVGSPHGLSPAYTAAKRGVAKLTRALTTEYAPYGITVNAIAPGFFHTNIMAVSGYTEAEITERYARLQTRIPLRREGLRLTSRARPSTLHRPPPMI